MPSAMGSTSGDADVVAPVVSRLWGAPVAVAGTRRDGLGDSEAVADDPGGRVTDGVGRLLEAHDVVVAEVQDPDVVGLLRDRRGRPWVAMGAPSGERDRCNALQSPELDRQAIERLRDRRLLHRHPIVGRNAPPVAAQHLVHDRLHLYLGEAEPDAEVRPAAEGHP